MEFSIKCRKSDRSTEWWQKFIDLIYSLSAPNWNYSGWVPVQEVAEFVNKIWTDGTKWYKMRGRSPHEKISLAFRSFCFSKVDFYSILNRVLITGCIPVPFRDESLCLQLKNHKNSIKMIDFCHREPFAALNPVPVPFSVKMIGSSSITVFLTIPVRNYELRDWIKFES